MIPGFSTIKTWMRFAWLTKKTEDLKSNKGNLSFPSHTVIVIELQIIKKGDNPLFLHQLLLFRFIPTF